MLHAIIFMMSPKMEIRFEYSESKLHRLNSLWAWLIAKCYQAGETIRRTRITIPTGLFVLSILIFILVRLIGLVDFPIYFFTDEAAQTILAQDFLRDGFKNYAGELFPTFFENGSKYNLGFSVYAQIIPFVLFGRSVFVTRVISVFFASLAAVALALILRDFFKVKYYWLGVRVLSMTPAWFLHSRTAFETALAVSVYTLFIYFYYLYRFRNRKHLFISLFLGALAFYSYSSMQPVVILTGVLLLLLDGPYHMRGRWITLGGAVELIFLSLPYIRFIFTHPYESARQLQMLDSYWVTSASFSDKILSFFSEYFKGFNPFFGMVTMRMNSAGM
ncbi:MAG: glycosyltransferase family 39 protein [Anaerolineaceae bacterium]|nr:glycosyltransferase family 39 protein [Anaerolineaceae bacterium]